MNRIERQGADAWSIRERNSSSVISMIRRRFVREVSPRIRRIRCRAIPSVFAMSRSSLEFALPRSGGATTWTRSTPSRKPPIRSRDDRGCTRTSTSMSREPESRTIGSVFQQDLVAGLLDVNITGQRCPHAVQLYHHEAEAVGDGPRLVLSNRTDVAPTPHR